MINENDKINENIESAEMPQEPTGSSALHRAKGRARRSLMRSQIKGIIALCVCIALLVVGLAVATYFVNIYNFTDLDSTKYKVMKKGGEYALCTEDGYKLNTTDDGYYITDLGTLVKVDPKSGNAEIYAVVDTEEGEFLGTNKRILMFKHISQDNTQQVEVHNQYGSYVFYRDANDKFQIKGYEDTPYSATLFSSLVVSSGYSLTMQKIANPIKDENGKYTEYGLAPETRYDADGNAYAYEPMWYRITDTSGNAYTVYVGNAIPSNGGFYVKYTERDAVYIMNYSVDASILNMYNPDAKTEDVFCVYDIPIENYVTPSVTYPMTMTTYFNVHNFMLFDGKELMAAPEDATVLPVVSFSYWDMDERTGTFYANNAYRLHYPKGYYVNDNSVDMTLQSFCYLNPNRVVKLGVTEKDLEEYKLDEPAYVISFDFYPDGNEKNKVEHLIFISEKTDRDTYYMTSAIYDMIVEVDRSQLLFLEYKLIDWVDASYFQMNLAWATKVVIEKDGMAYTFLLDNSLSDSVTNPTCSETAKQKGTITSDMMTVYAFDSAGNKMQAISEISVVDTNGIIWTIDDDSITAKNAKGEAVAITNAYYANNSIGEKVVVLEPGKGIACADGRVVGVTADKITIKTADGIVTTYLRYGMKMFRKLYQSILYASIDGDVHDGAFGLTDEQIAEYGKNPDQGFQAKITIETSHEDTTYVYRFYSYSERRSMLTINGAPGEFYVLRSFTDKILTDADRVIQGQLVDPTSKY